MEEELKRINAKIAERKRRKVEQRVMLLSLLGIALILFLAIKSPDDVTIKTETNKGETIKVAYEISQEEFEMVARTVAAEARGEELKGQMAVAQTIRDRRIATGKELTDIVTEPNQYATPYEGNISNTTYTAVQNIFIGGLNIFDELTTHFYNPDYASPSWADELEYRGTIGAHKFYQ